MEFTKEELEILAEFICERTDILTEIVEDPKITSKEFKSGSKIALRTINSLDLKLRPYYKKGKK
jgi:hypothetical protein